MLEDLGGARPIVIKDGTFYAAINIFQPRHASNPLTCFRVWSRLYPCVEEIVVRLIPVFFQIGVSGSSQ